MTNWRSILSWQVSNEYSFDEMITMLRGGQVWKRSTEREVEGGYTYLYVINPFITERWIGDTGEQYATIARGIWSNIPDWTPESGMANAGISQSGEPFTLMKADFTQLRESSLKLGWSTHPYEDIIRLIEVQRECIQELQDMDLDEHDVLPNYANRVHQVLGYTPTRESGEWFFNKYMSFYVAYELAANAADYLSTLYRRAGEGDGPRIGEAEEKYRSLTIRLQKLLNDEEAAL